MSVDTQPRTLVLHELRLKGLIDVPAVADAVGVAEAAATTLLEELVADGLAAYRDGHMSGFTLSPAGRAEHALSLAAELDGNGLRDAVHRSYQQFLAHNGDLLEVCTDWQIREVDGEPKVNDHTDSAHDQSVIERLAAIDVEIEPVCADLASELSRFGRYRPQLDHAMERVAAGDTDWFTKPMIPSYHTVWFELHEDLLATLGIERGQEERA